MPDGERQCVFPELFLELFLVCCAYTSRWHSPSQPSVKGNTNTLDPVLILHTLSLRSYYHHSIIGYSLVLKFEALSGKKYYFLNYLLNEIIKITSIFLIYPAFTLGLK